MSQYSQRRKEPQELKRSTRLFSFLYFVILVVAAYFLAGLALAQVNLDNLLDFEIPLVNLSGRQIPDWAIQVALAVIILMILQFIIVFLFGLLKGRKKDVYEP